MVVFFPNIMIGILWITIWAIISDFMMIEVEIIKNIAKKLAILNKNAYICS